MLDCPDCQKRFAQHSKGGKIGGKRRSIADNHRVAVIAARARWSKSKLETIRQVKDKRKRDLDDYYNGTREP